MQQVQAYIAPTLFGGKDAQAPIEGAGVPFPDAAFRDVYKRQDYMRLALQLAKKGCGWTSPNPMVGAVVVKEGRIIGQGWHQRYGQAPAAVSYTHLQPGADPEGHAGRLQ